MESPASSFSSEASSSEAPWFEPEASDCESAKEMAQAMLEAEPSRAVLSIFGLTNCRCVL